MGVAFQVLGPFKVAVDGVDVTPAAPKARALLALLVLRAGRIASADRIMEELGPDLDADRARHALHVRVAEVRKLVRDATGQSRLASVPPGYRLDAASHEIDEQRFGAATRSATCGWARNSRPRRPGSPWPMWTPSRTASTPSSPAATTKP